jgi:hypothetical protein
MNGHCNKRPPTHFANHLISLKENHVSQEETLYPPRTSNFSKPNLSITKEKVGRRLPWGSSLHVHDLHKRPGIFITLDSHNHYDVNHSHTKPNASKQNLL